ncbi:N-acetyltransferase [Enterococcus florum]|uniref:N-acetyltransferase n=1 Tax=Enterococcus florum TaxID=2480627 RepID=A0A4P5P636_9ENTE|nr:GNAT family N-acetyltransferase [Enterococcus florum]GCF93345.1 N-acetyltransferase [Enterococcus florum]
MLDKSVPFIPFTMFRPAESPPLPAPKLPEGYRFTFYQPGDETDWYQIEQAVLEFDSVEQAADYFKKTFAPYPQELQQRMLFIENPTGKKVATCTAWWTSDSKPRLHWLAVLPEEQGKGLAKALTIKITALMENLNPHQTIYLTTQTWSHLAVRLYQKLGYQILQDEHYSTILELLEGKKK